ncbi:MAG: ATP-binding cassette domain-containing protein [Pseudomonadota bacterium]
MQLKVEHLSYHFGNKKALNQVSFELGSGFNILLGPNGAGKSTLFSLLTGLRRVSEGQIWINQLSMKSDRQNVMRHLGVVFQENTLDLDLSVYQNLDYFASLHGLRTKDAIEKIEGVLEHLGLSSRLDDKVRSLNGGHRRRLEIARSLLHQPSCLLFDEPTVGLDIESRQLILAFMHDYVSRTNALVLWATHLLEEVSDDDHLLLLANGQLKGDDICRRLVEDNGVDSVSALFNKYTKKGKN